MNKITYNTSNLFTLKKYNDNNLNCRSYEYPTIYGIRCAILSSIIQIEGVEKAKDLFYKVKNSIIYVQYPNEFLINGIKLKRYSNSYYSMKDEEKIDREKLISNNFKTTMGFREHIYLPQIIFYIDNNIPNIELYLKNIDWIGSAESLVYLNSIEKTNNLENVLTKWNGIEDTCLFQQHDYCNETTFDNVYMYSQNYKHIHDSFMCCIKNFKI